MKRLFAALMTVFFLGTTAVVMADDMATGSTAAPAAKSAKKHKAKKAKKAKKAAAAAASTTPAAK